MQLIATKGRKGGGACQSNGSVCPLGIREWSLAHCCQADSFYLKSRTGMNGNP